MTTEATYNDPEDPKADTRIKKYLPEYPLYPASEDIYNQSLQEEEIDPENISQLKIPNEAGLNETGDERGVENVLSDDDLDIPGSELDDQQEEIGSEDEENNYYSLGGDNHNNLEEDKGD